LKTPNIPNTFSPNGDGIHDKWEIKYLNTYPGCTVEIYNRYGQLVFQSTSYNKPWDGTFKDKQLPAGTYYYIINPKNGRKQMSGFVDIIR
jgi:gliding motility-associated-like protein